ncbi:MAG: hypothetical protein FD123_2261 [Bacteroidetes bacterium]|nr:MAG: hypothetical protein FD123_2261 [Bacteroidota bacterium]
MIMKTKMIFAASLVLSAALISCQPKDPKEADSGMVNVGGEKGGLPVMKFEVEKHDFGRITQGERVTYEFKFKNTGGSDLLISDAHGSCGCTVPSYPKKPVAPGEESVINVEFNSEGKSGKQEKTVTLITNCEPNTRVITILAEVSVPESRQPKPAGQ